MKDQHNRPDSMDTCSDVVERIAEEYLERLRNGDGPQLEEYTRSHPEVADELREVLGAVSLMQEFAPGHSQGVAFDTPDVFEPPRQLGDYRIVRELGRGGMGVVYEAEHSTMRRRVALKVLFPHTGKGLVLERFLREARAAGRLHHSNIVPVFEVGSDADTHFYAMQRIRGQNLDNVIDDLRRFQDGPVSETPSSECSQSVAHRLLTGQYNHSQLIEDAAAVPAVGTKLPSIEADVKSANLSSDSLSEVGEKQDDYFHRVARIALQVADALAYAHDQGVLHRDIKPANLILDTTGTVWVTDFGLARSEDEDLTLTGDILGTLRYMAPERFEGNADQRSDVYSLGLTLYELCTLRYAFDREDRADLVRQVTRETPAKPRSVNAEVPRDLETIVLKSIAREPSQRYASAAKMAEDLRLFLDDRPIRARRSSVIEHGWRWCRRNPYVAAMLWCIATLLAVIFVGTIVFAINTQDYADDLVVKTRRAVLAEKIAVESANDERIARNTANSHLFEAYFQRAQAERRNRLTGRREAGLDALKLAAKLLPSLRLSPEEFDRQRRRLRNEATAVLAKTDITINPDLDADYTAAVVAYDYAYQKYAVSRMNVIDVRRTSDDGSLLEIPQTEIPARLLAFSFDGRYLAAIHWHSSFRKRYLRVWDCENDVSVLNIETAASNFCFSGDSDDDGFPRLAVINDGSIVTIYNLRDVSNPKSRDFGFHLEDVQFLNHDQTIAVVGEKNAIEFWSAESDTTESLATTTKWAALDWCAKTNQLAVGAQNGTIEIFDMDRRASRFRLIGHEDSVHTISISSDGELLASTSWDGTTRMWIVRGELEFKRLEHNRLLCGFSRDGQNICFSDPDNQVDVYRIVRHAPKIQYFSNRDLPRRNDISFHPVNPRLAAVASSHHVELWDLKQRKIVGLLGSRRTFAARFSNDGRDLVSSGRSGLRRWQISVGDQNRWPDTLEWQEAFLVQGFDTDRIDTTPNLDRIAYVKKYDQVAYVIDSDNPGQRTEMTGVSDVVKVAISPDGRWVVASRESEADLTIWNADTGKPIAKLAPGCRTNITFSPDGRWLGGSGQNRSFLWRVGTWETVHQLDHPVSHPGAVAFSPDSRMIAMTHNRFHVNLLDRETFQSRVLLGAGEHRTIESATFSPDGTRLALTLQDSFEIWDLRDLRQQLAEMGLEW